MGHAEAAVALLCLNDEVASVMPACGAARQSAAARRQEENVSSASSAFPEQ